MRQNAIILLIMSDPEKSTARRIDQSIAVEGQASFAEFVGRADSWKFHVSLPRAQVLIDNARARVSAKMNELGIPPNESSSS